jgi:hypothetical protein
MPVNRNRRIPICCIVLVVLNVLCVPAPAHAGRCDAAPYGVPPDKYPVLVRLLTNLFGAPKTELISQVCKMKFDGADRAALYKLGFTDEQIDMTDTETLVVDTLKALKKALEQLPPESKH